jgi:elongator complex protein 3
LDSESLPEYIPTAVAQPSAERVYAAKLAAKKIMARKGRCSLEQIKREASQEFSVKGVIRNSEILAQIPARKRSAKILSLLLMRPMRTISGISPVAIMSRPLELCPHGVCVYCPKGKNASRSYTGHEPAAMRAIQHDYDPYGQVSGRLGHYHALGHVTDKCQLIAMGGTFLAQDREYQEWFVKRAFDAFNGKESKGLEDAKRKNEKAKNRVIGITFETKPDWAKEKHVDGMLRLGGTSVELGVQQLSDKIYRKVNRGHTLADVVEATRICKDAGLKVTYHMMPGLFNSPQGDVENFRRLFSDPGFRPDMLKIYPCLVMRETPLYKMWKDGKFQPYDTDMAANVIADATKYIPKYVRVMRMQRDIPTHLISAGVMNSNLTQVVEKKLRGRGERCNCIRCREAGLAMIKEARVAKDAELLRMDYEASGGTEIFLSYEDEKENLLIGFCRLRIPSGKAHRNEITDKTAIVRELHVYGEEVGVGNEKAKALQHKGYGSKLLIEAERIAKGEFGKKKMVVISGVGAREYYYKRGYRPDGPYVSKGL